MRCRQCQSENPPQNAFCHSCGTPLASAGAAPAAPSVIHTPMVRCATCGVENGKNMQFCRMCGSELASAAAQAAAGGLAVDISRAPQPQPVVTAPAPGPSPALAGPV